MSDNILQLNQEVIHNEIKDLSLLNFVGLSYVLAWFYVPYNLYYEVKKLRKTAVQAFSMRFAIPLFWIGVALLNTINIVGVLSYIVRKLLMQYI